MKYDDFLGLVKERRSIRRFRPDPVPDEYVDKIIEAARWAPSGYNSQPWEFVVVRKQEFKDGIVRLIEDYRAQRMKMESTREPWQQTLTQSPPDAQMDYTAAPVFILLFGDSRTRLGLPMLLRYDHESYRKTYLSALAGAFLYMHLAATTLGLASQWVSGVQFPVAHCLIKDMLGIPAGMEVYDMMAVGYPAVDPRPKLMRDKEKMVHRNYCGSEDFRTDAEVDDFIRRTRTWNIATMARKAD